MIITKFKKKYPIHYGLGIKYRKDLRGRGIFSTIKKFGKPTLKYLGRFLKNNLPEILGITKNIIAKHENKPTVKQVIRDIKQDPNLTKMSEKSIADHFRGQGLNKKSKS